MEIRVIGAHNLPSRGSPRHGDTRHTCFLMDGVLAVDSGGLSSALSAKEQGRIQAILLTHQHFDHIRDVPPLALMTLDDPQQIDLYSQAETLDSVHSHLMNGKVYPDFTEKLTEAPPKYRLRPIEPGKWIKVLDYSVKPVAQPHPVPSVGYIVTSDAGACVGYTGDTGGHLLPFFQDPSRPLVLFIDVTFPSRQEDLAKLTGHLTPALLREEILQAQASGVDLPRMVAVHTHVPDQDEVAKEVAQVARELGVDLSLGSEEMRVVL